jgi:TPR repeat protein
MTDWKKAAEREELQKAVQLIKLDRAQAILKLEMLAASGSATASQLAMFNLGTIFDSSEARDCAAAEAWLRRAGDAGLKQAEFRLGEMLRREGRFEEALATVKRSAAVGYSPSMRLVGRMNHDGQGTSRDLAEARRWMERAVDRGNVFAKRYLAAWMIRGEFGWLNIPAGILLYILSILNAAVILATRSGNDTRVN